MKKLLAKLLFEPSLWLMAECLEEIGFNKKTMKLVLKYLKHAKNGNK